MQYLLLIYANESTEPKPGSAEWGPLMQGYQAFSEEVVAAGVMQGGNALEPCSTATTVTRENGKVEITDGPFAETREQLGGYYLLDCKDLDQALAFAAKIPSTEHGRVEVRPVMVFDD